MKQCVRCGRNVENDRKLWCSHCMEKVMDELEWRADRPLHYYFCFNLKKQKHAKNELWKMLKADW